MRQANTDMQKVLGETFQPIVSPLKKLVDGAEKKKAVTLVAEEQKPSNIEELSSNNEDEEESQSGLDETV